MTCTLILCCVIMFIWLTLNIIQCMSWSYIYCFIFVSSKYLLLWNISYNCSPILCMSVIQHAADMALAIFSKYFISYTFEGLILLEENVL